MAQKRWIKRTPKTKALATTKTKSSTFKLRLHDLIYDLDSEDYHGTTGTYSSTQLKDALKDVETFYRKHIEKSIPRLSMEAFDIGSLFHTAVLEPHKLKKEFAIYQGAVRKGAAFEEFKAKNEGKIILTKGQSAKSLQLAKLVHESPKSMEMIEKSESEVSLFVELFVSDGEIYAPWYGARLTKFGWVPDSPPQNAKGVHLTVKVRADKLGDGFVLDLKSTTGDAKCKENVRDKVTYYGYDLSAAFYLDLFSVHLGWEAGKFYWTFASKDCNNCRTHVAEDETIMIGRFKWREAILNVAKGIETGWKIEDEIGSVKPNPWERHLLEDGIDFL